MSVIQSIATTDKDIDLSATSLLFFLPLLFYTRHAMQEQTRILFTQTAYSYSLNSGALLTAPSLLKISNMT